MTQVPSVSLIEYKPCSCSQAHNEHHPFTQTAFGMPPHIGPDALDKITVTTSQLILVKIIVLQ